MTLLEGDLFRVPTERSFDIVWSQGLIEHFEDPAAVVCRHVECCRPGGIVLISVPWRYSYFTPWYLLTRSRMLRRFWPWSQQRFHTKASLEALMTGVPRSEYREFRVRLLQPCILGIILLEIRV
jgi:2-polyprenyl-3-methyl-5-hydroxy-6-metoxy-1,4-benzoquinol methylase